jgi:hypothetical protein
MEIQENYKGIYVDQKNLGNLSALGYVLFSVVSLGSILLMCWTWLNRTSRPVQASQPFFMIMLCIGSIIMASAMIPMSFVALLVSSPGIVFCCSCSLRLAYLVWLLGT